MVWLSGKLSYGDVVEVLEEEGELLPSKSTVWQLVQRWGKRFQAVIAAEAQQEKARAKEWSTPQGRLPSGQMGLAIDGAMLHLIGEGWKEFKLASVFEVAEETRRDRRNGDHAEFGHAENLSYIASLADANAFGEQVWVEAQRRDWQWAQDSQVLGDGAVWIWNIRAEHFPESHELVDWYHATEHLGVAKLLLYPEDSPAAQRWYRAQELALFQGHALRVARDLTRAAERLSSPEVREALSKEAQYFQRNHRRMHYQEMRDLGWPIGSGMVESGAKQFKHRFTAPGMRWSRSGAEHLFPIRAAIMTGRPRFNQLWAKARLISPIN